MTEKSGWKLTLLTIFFIYIIIYTLITQQCLIGIIVMIILVFALYLTGEKNRARRRSESILRTDVKRTTAGAADKKIQCAYCGKLLKMTEDVQYCRYCGQIIPYCRICGSPIVYGDKILQCPHCKAYAHKTHLIEWIKVKGYCPVCGVDVEEIKDFPAELLEETRTIISKEKETVSPSDEEQRCTSCGRLITENVRYCPYCGKQLTGLDSST